MKEGILLQIHVVQPTDTLWKISKFYGIDILQIIEANQLQNQKWLVIGQALVIPTAAGTFFTPRPVIEVNGYLSKTGIEGWQAVIKTSSDLSSVSISSYHIKPDGSIAEYASSTDETKLLKTITSQQLVPIMVISNFVENKFNTKLVHTILSDRQAQNVLILNILTVMKAKGYVGLNIDFEFIDAEDRDLLNHFVQQVVNRLHPQGYSVSIALPAKTNDTTTGFAGAYDYAVLGQFTDFVVLMTYDWGWVGGPPFPIAPINEVKKVLDYAVSVISRNKILMGIPLYAYDWKSPYKEGETPAEMISSYEAVIRASEYGASIQYNPIYQSPFFHYQDRAGIKHEVWFEDARSVQVKYHVVKEYNLRGVSYWEIAFSFPQNWLLLNEIFRVRK